MLRALSAAALVFTLAAGCASSGSSASDNGPTRSERRLAAAKAAVRRADESAARAELERRNDVLSYAVRQCGSYVFVRDSSSIAGANDQCQRLADETCLATLPPAEFGACAIDVQNGRVLGRSYSCDTWQDGLVMIADQLTIGCVQDATTLVSTVPNDCPDGTRVYVSDIGWGKVDQPFHAGTPPDAIDARCA